MVTVPHEMVVLERMSHCRGVTVCIYVRMYIICTCIIMNSLYMGHALNTCIQLCTIDVHAVIYLYYDI